MTIEKVSWHEHSTRLLGRPVYSLINRCMHTFSEKKSFWFFLFWASSYEENKFHEWLIAENGMWPGSVGFGEITRLASKKVSLPSCNASHFDGRLGGSLMRTEQFDTWPQCFTLWILVGPCRSKKFVVRANREHSFELLEQCLPLRWRGIRTYLCYIYISLQRHSESLFCTSIVFRLLLILMNIYLRFSITLRNLLYE